MLWALRLISLLVPPLVSILLLSTKALTVLLIMLVDSEPAPASPREPAKDGAMAIAKDTATALEVMVELSMASKVKEPFLASTLSLAF